MEITAYHTMISSRRSFYITLILVVFVQIVLSFQGFDVCDDGFVLTGYQQIFNAPESVEYNFVYWLSTLMGGVWYQLFPSGGVLWFRILAVLVNTLTFVLAYRLLKNYIKPIYALLGLSMVLFVNDFGFLVFYHNQFTALFAVSIAYFLERGLVKNSIRHLLISGVLIGVNVSTRLPNITLSVLILVIPYAYYLNGKRLKQSIKPIMYFILGIIMGLAIILILLLALGHLQISQNAIATLFNLGATRGSGHSILDMLKIVVINYQKVFILGVGFTGFIGIAIIASVYFQKQRLVKYLIYAATFVVFLYVFKREGIHAVYAFSLIGLLGILIKKQTDISLKVISFMALLILICLPLGSGGGMRSSGYMCIWLAVPISLYFIAETNTLSPVFKSKSNVVSGRFLTAFSVVIALSYFAAKGYSMSREAYFDPGSRLEKTSGINNQFAQYVYTTEERADIINELLMGIDGYVKPNDYLLAFDNIPMVHFMTETKPYVNNPWPMIYDSVSFEEKLSNAEVSINEYPIVVQQKFITIGAFSEPIPDYLNANEERGVYYNKERTQAMISFLERNAYEMVWSNDYFNIYKTSKVKRK
ncbi:MAG: glycosyltransferase family 39 protein [Bacteroidota bacterium]